MQMSSQVASRGGHYGIDWPEVIAEAVHVCVCEWVSVLVCMHAHMLVRTDEATTVFPLVNLCKPC